MCLILRNMTKNGLHRKDRWVSRVSMAHGQQEPMLFSSFHSAILTVVDFCPQYYHLMVTKQLPELQVPYPQRVSGRQGNGDKSQIAALLERKYYCFSLHLTGQN